MFVQVYMRKRSSLFSCRLSCRKIASHFFRNLSIMKTIGLWISVRCRKYNLTATFISNNTRENKHIMITIYANRMSASQNMVCTKYVMWFSEKCLHTGWNLFLSVKKFQCPFCTMVMVIEYLYLFISLTMVHDLCSLLGTAQASVRWTMHTNKWIARYRPF